MSAIIGLFGTAARIAGDEVPRGMLAAARRGTDACDILRAPGCVLGVSRHAWETASGFAGPAEVALADGMAVVTDASLYHRAGLIARLRSHGCDPPDGSAAQLVAAAYRVWGDRLPEHLEGDFAFILWDSRRGAVVCARDFAGKRPLLFAEADGGLVVGSGAASILAHPRLGRALNLASVAETAAGMWAYSDETAFRAVRRLHAGHTLVWRGQAARCEPHWRPPLMEASAPSSFEDGARELRRLLISAAAERLPESGPSAVWMSGGWDSTAVFASGRVALGDEVGSRPLDPISISYPPGDAGREDEIIQAIADRYAAPVGWIDIGTMPMLEGTLERAARRDEPLVHPFELWNRALIDRTVAAGARVAFDGNGGDQLFFTSNVFFADLLLQGRWRELRREWRRKGGSELRDFLAVAVRPLLPTGALRLIESMGGPRPDPVFERAVPPWIRADFQRRHGLRERERRLAPDPRTGGLAAREAYWYLVTPHFHRAYGLLSSFALEAGVELRSPLLDRRVVEFAAARPREERNAGREIKRLLRAAMRGLLPDEVLAPRDTKTGTLETYFAGEMRKRFAPLAEAALAGRPLLAELGILEPGEFRRALAEYRRTEDGWLGYALHQTVQVELWLRAQDTASRRTPVAGSGSFRRAPALVAAATPGRAPGESPDLWH